MRILGISSFYHDSAAAIIDDGVIIAAAQEERFTRIKHDAGFPHHAVQYCLDEAGITIDQLDNVAFYDKPLLKFERLLETYLAFAPSGFKSFSMAIPVWLTEKLFLKSLLVKELAKLGGDKKRMEAIMLFSEHHLSHAASAFYPSPFDNAAVLTMDGVGEWATTSLAMGTPNSLNVHKEIHFPHSIGLLYSAFTYYLGFKVNSGEYKVMGLAPYGEPRFAQTILDKLIDVKADGSFRLNMKYFNYCTGLTMTNEHFNQLFGAPARTDENLLTQREMDIAASIQAVTEEVVLRLTRSIAASTGSKNLCLAGGVALNCVANGKILRDGAFENIWIQPASGDAGGALGAALAAWHLANGRPKRQMTERAVTERVLSEQAFSERPLSEQVVSEQALSEQFVSERDIDEGGRVASERVNNGMNSRVRDHMRGSYLGPAFAQSDIESRLLAAGAKFHVIDDAELFTTAAAALADEKALGWFQGRMEFGPRALGGRSIIGDARSERMQSVLNLKVKYRESFRPFAPSVLAGRAHEYFDIDVDVDSPYMLLVADVVENRRTAMSEAQQALFGIQKLNVPRSDIPAVTHVDYSARIQTVHQDTNPRYHALISAFEALTACPVVVNTSFNVRGEPIVGSPEDAFRCFMGTDLDALAVGNCWLLKQEQSAALRENYKDQFALD